MTTAATDAVRDALQRACGTDAVRPAGRGDEVGGRSPRWVAAPADTAALAALVRACGEHQLAMVARGEGGKLDWGNPPRRVDVLIDMGRLAGVYRHDADDLVATVGAGTPLRAVQAALAKRNQRLAIDPGSADATIGGMLAVGEAGPLRLGYGTPRDQLIGVEFVRTDGVIGHSGGRVVKNVAGYDLGKLLAGSYGTLALMTSATFRVHPRPMARAFVSRPVTSPLEAHDIVLALLGSGLAPAAIELDLPVINPGAVPPMVSRPTPGRRAMPGGSLPDRPRATGGETQPAGGPDSAPQPASPADPPPTDPARVSRTERPGRVTTTGTVAVLLEGSTAGVKARASDASKLMRGATIAERPPEWWGQYPFETDDVALKIAAPVADLYAALYALRDAAGFPVSVRGSAGVGVCYASLPGRPLRPAGTVITARGPQFASPMQRHAQQIGDVVTAMRTTMIARGGSCVVLNAPAAVREAIDVWGEVGGLDLMRSVKRQFDPHDRLAPGRFVGGI
ncbi:MAG TPA: FAD-binding oxidoreductase [Micromonosporaceae bacterium]